MDPPVDPGPLYEKLDCAFRGLREFSLINAAVELGIFDACTTPLNVDDLASRISADVEMCDLLCNALTSEGLLTGNNGKYSDTAIALAYLTNRLTVFTGALCQATCTNGTRPVGITCTHCT